MNVSFDQPPGASTKSSGVEGFVEKLFDRLFPGARSILPRIAILFASLCLIKLAMLFVFRRYLFEEHWRVEHEPQTGINPFFFYLFAVLVGWHLWRLGSHCRRIGEKNVHWANGLVLALGALFIFLTFHSGDESYLRLVMRRVLSWNDVGWNIRLNLFFQWPYLAAWMFIYALIYYGLVRSGRGGLILQVTAIFAAAYTAFCLTQLQDDVSALVIVDCLGIAGLLAARNDFPLKIKWLFFPWFCVGLLYLLFLTYGQDLRDPVPEFVLLALGSLVLFVGMSVLAWRRNFYSAWSWSLPFAFFGFLLLVNTHYSMSANYNHLLCIALWLPRYFLGEFLLAGILLGAGCGYRKLHPRGRLFWLDCVSLALLTFALIDLQLSRIMGVRLDWQVLLFGDSPKMMWKLALPHLPLLVLLIVALALFYLVSLGWMYWQQERYSNRSRSVGRKNGVVFFVSALLLLGVTGKWMTNSDKVEGETVFRFIASSPLWKGATTPPMDLATLKNKMGELDIRDPRQSAVASPPQPSRNLNVVLIFQESSYNKYLSLFGGVEGTQPLLSEYKDRMELFPNFFASFAGSIYARFAAFTGLYPVQDFHLFTVNRIPVKSVFEALHDQGYSCSLFYSSFFDYTAFRDFLRGRDLDEMYDADTMPGQRKTEPVTWGVREEETLGAIQDRIKKYAAEGQKFFLTYIPAAPHYPFDAIPERFRRHKMVELGNYEPAYLNELLYMDWVIASILDELKTNGLLEKTLVVITADHGEMLGVDGGPIGHGWAVTPELANIPLIIMDPDKPGYRLNETVGSEVDLLPTILDDLGLPIPAHQFYEGLSLYSAEAQTNRVIYLNSLRQFAIIHGKNLICGDRETGSGGNDLTQNAFKIVNEGSRAFFDAIPDAALNLAAPMSEFDKFQENFLRNYSSYCQMIWAAEVKSQ